MPADRAYAETTRRVERTVSTPETLGDADGWVRGERRHLRRYGVCIRRPAALPRRLPARYERFTDQPGADVGLKASDHIGSNVERGKPEEWATFYREVLALSQLVHCSDRQISTEYTTLMSSQ